MTGYDYVNYWPGLGILPWYVNMGIGLGIGTACVVVAWVVALIVQAMK